ncbi:transposase [Streptomyces griseoluteus]|jgi:transposase|uniref:transposase n=1 Tax=Streptomyces griseoluteus TaxID=29306 RepID=UPI00341C2696
MPGGGLREGVVSAQMHQGDPAASLDQVGVRMLGGGRADVDLEPLLPDRTPKRGGWWRDHREVIDAIAYKFQTGTQWMHLPEKYGNWRGVYNRLRILVAKRREDDRRWPVQEFREFSSSFCHEHAVEEIHPPYLILWPRAILQIVPGSDSWIRRSVFGSILVVLAVGEAV